jgi:hypothetical protein
MFTQCTADGTGLGWESKHVYCENHRLQHPV